MLECSLYRWLSLRAPLARRPDRSIGLNDGTIRKTLRRRRSWYQRRLRIQRTLVAVVASALIAGACWQNAAHHLSLPSWHASQILPDSFWAQKRRPQRSRFDGGALRPARQVSRLDFWCLSLLGCAWGREGCRRTPLCGGAGLRGSPALRPLRLQPRPPGARQRGPRSLSFVSHS